VRFDAFYAVAFRCASLFFMSSSFVTYARKEAPWRAGQPSAMVSVNISSQNLSGNSEWQVRHIDI